MNEIHEKGHQIATLAGGCFWCMEKAFGDLKGVIGITSGYTGGHKENPSYKEVCSGRTGHYEAVQIVFDPSVLSYERLLDFYWRQIDPTDTGGQFFDRGLPYITAIFYHNQTQKQAAEMSRKALNESGRFGKPVATEILPASRFYPAEGYHQSYHKKNPLDYTRYHDASGRDDFKDKHWGRHKDDELLKKNLTRLQYEVIRLNATEPPFKNEYWDNKREGIYVDIVSGTPLFSSSDKYDSGCGWPSFTRPVHQGNIVSKKDLSCGMVRTEVRSKESDSHLGHVFNDGPAPAGLRYCINSAALRFVPREDLEKEGYGQYKNLFN